MTQNRHQGKAAEQLAVADLKAKGYDIHGTQVRLTDDVGNQRYADILATAPGSTEIEAFEVKSGNAPYKRPQSSFDLNMETNGVKSNRWPGKLKVGTTLLRY